VRIDSTYGVNQPGVPDGKGPQAKPPAASISGSSGEEAVEFLREPHVQQALSSGAADRQSVIDQAKKLVQSGELDTPEAIRRAAQAILSRGI
jgi:hypothetical protein